MKREDLKILIERYLEGAASPAEVKELCDWIKTNDSLDQWLMREIEQSDAHIDQAVYDRLYARIKESIDARESVPFYKRKFFVSAMRWAASTSPAPSRREMKLPEP